MASAARQGELLRDQIDLDHEHQIIENFGASDAWSMQKLGTWSLENRNRIADLLFSQTQGIGLSCWRFNLGGGVNPRITNPWRTAETFELSEGRYDWTRQAGERWFLGAAKARGVPQFLAFVNSPPGRLTRNGFTFCEKGPDTTNLKPGYEEQYARYLGTSWNTFAPTRRGVSILSLLMSALSMSRNGIGRATRRKAIGPATRIFSAFCEACMPSCNAAGHPPRLPRSKAVHSPDLWHLDVKATAAWKAPYGNYLDAFVGDPAIRPLLADRLSYHDYGSDRVAGELVEHRTKLGEKFVNTPAASSG